MSELKLSKTGESACANCGRPCPAGSGRAFDFCADCAPSAKDVGNRKELAAARATQRRDVAAMLDMAAGSLANMRYVERGAFALVIAALRVLNGEDVKTLPPPDPTPLPDVRDWK